MAMQLASIQTNAKGGKYLPLRGEGGDPPTWKSEFLKVLWNPSSYGDPEAVRVSVCLEPDKAAREFFLEVEDQVAAQLSEHSSRDQRIFGKFLPPHDVKQRMVSALKVSTRGRCSSSTAPFGASRRFSRSLMTIRRLTRRNKPCMDPIYVDGCLRV